MTESGTQIELVGSKDPMQMLGNALQQGVSPDSLGKLMDLAERWHDGEARRTYALAMSDAQAEMPVVVKDRFNSQTNSRYASLERVMSDIRDVYLRHRFTVSFTDCEATARPGDDRAWVRVTAIVRHASGHQEEFYQEAPIDDQGIGGKKNKTGVQGMASTRSYLQRYLLTSIFGVVIADTDKDGNTSNVTINDGQADELDSLCRAVGDDMETYRKVINHYKIDDIHDLPASRFNQAKKRIEATINAKKAGAA